MSQSHLYSNYFVKTIFLAVRVLLGNEQLPGRFLKYY